MKCCLVCTDSSIHSHTIARGLNSFMPPAGTSSTFTLTWMGLRSATLELSPICQLSNQSFAKLCVHFVLFQMHNLKWQTNRGFGHAGEGGWGCPVLPVNFGPLSPLLGIVVRGGGWQGMARPKLVKSSRADLCPDSGLRNSLTNLVHLSQVNGGEKYLSRAKLARQKQSQPDVLGLWPHMFYCKIGDNNI